MLLQLCNPEEMYLILYLLKSCLSKWSHELSSFKWLWTTSSCGCGSASLVFWSREMKFAFYFITPRFTFVAVNGRNQIHLAKKLQNYSFILDSMLVSPKKTERREKNQEKFVQEKLFSIWRRRRFCLVKFLVSLCLFFLRR